MTAERTGIVLAGGYSTRFGDREKALAEVDGEPMLTHVVTRLGSVVGTVVVNCRTDQRERFAAALAAVTTPVRFAVDAVPDEGPLAGLKTALEAVETEYVAVAACDMPAIDPALVDFLFERASGHDAAVPEDRDGVLQPTQAVYRTAAVRSGADAKLAAGHRSLRAILGDLDVAVVSAGEVTERADPRTFRDLNTREALDAFDSPE